MVQIESRVESVSPSAPVPINRSLLTVKQFADLGYAKMLVVDIRL